MRSGLAELRAEPTEKQVRALIAGREVVDSTRAVLVWEPRRVVPSYAVPVDDLRAELVPAQLRPSATQPILHPGIPFAAHSAGGEAYDLRLDGATRDQAAFRPSDPDLHSYVVLDFHAFDEWREEDEPLVGHPRDPFHRIDIRHSSRTVRIELNGRLLAESARPVLVFETSLPTRFYLPREDIVADLRPSAKRTLCAYKGEASYWSLDEAEDLAWTYVQPLGEAAALTGLIAFFDERADVTLDGRPRERPRTPLSRALLEEAGVQP
jgi:uncharacterized protein (DUF427 family)